MTSKFSDQIIIFRHLTTDELDEDIKLKKYDAILRDQYNQFVDLCNLVMYDENVADISCEYNEMEERLDFSITYK
jgi:hypothetical protein